MELILSLAKENAGADKQTLISNLAAAYTTLQARAEEIKSNGIGQMSSAARQSLANLEEKQRQLLEALGHELEDVERAAHNAQRATHHTRRGARGAQRTARNTPHTAWGTRRTAHSIHLLHLSADRDSRSRQRIRQTYSPSR